MKLLMLAATLLAGLAAPALSCDLTAGPGSAIRLTEGRSGGLFSAGCIFGEKWELRGYYFGEQKIYGNSVTIDGYAGLSAARVWLFRDGRRIRPYLAVGLMAKESQRCHYNGDLDCNRLAPLPFCFLASVGVKLGDIIIVANHCSNDGLDHGPEKKNLGQDFIRAEVWF